jgi:hypothetical protein
MSVFNPIATVDSILSHYSVGDIVPAEALSEFIDTRSPEDHDTFGVAKQLLFERLTRIKQLRDEFLSRKILAIQEENTLVLIKPVHHVDRALRRVKHKVDAVLRRGVHEVANLDMAGLPSDLITEQHDAAVYLDNLRTALNPRSRRLRINIVKTA